MNDSKDIIGKKINLWQPVFKVKGNEGVSKYEAVLSDNSLDRDGEIVGKTALEGVKNSDVIVGLMDHENKILNQVCVWQNKRMEKRKGHDALVSEPKFFLSNPNAKIVKGMLDEGAPMGVSIGAIVKKYEMQKINGEEVKVYTEIEILEASFVAVPANKHAGVYAVAKMFKTKEENTMEEKTYSEKEYKEVSETVDGLNKQISESKENLDKAVKDKETAEKALEDFTAETEKSSSEKEEQILGLEKEIKEIKDSPMFKGDHRPEDEEDEKKNVEMKEALDKGMVPIVRRT